METLWKAFRKDLKTIKRTALFLKNDGWEVYDEKHDSANGADLTICRAGKSFRVEVKKVLIGKRCCLVKSVGSSGLKCDAIAILLPDNKVVLQPMNDHLKLCSKSGIRSMTDLVRLNKCESFIHTRISGLQEL